MAEDNPRAVVARWKRLRARADEAAEVKPTVIVAAAAEDAADDNVEEVEAAPAAEQETGPHCADQWLQATQIDHGWFALEIRRAAAQAVDDAADADAALVQTM